MNKFVILSCLALAMAVLGCGEAGKSPGHDGLQVDSPYQKDSISLVYGEHPERALVMLDSAVILGNIDDFNAQLYRATIFCKSLDVKQLDSAINICRTLLKHDSVTMNPVNYEAVLDLLISSSRAKADDNEYLRWSIQKATLCREQGREVELLRTEADIGMIMTHLGQTEIGLEKLDMSINQLDKPGSLDRMDAFIIAIKRKINVLTDLQRYAEIIPLAQRILDRLDHYEKHSDEYAADSYRFSWSEHPQDRERYLDFCRAQAHGFLAQSYAMTGNKQKALEYLKAFEQSGYGKTFSAHRMIVPVQMALGFYENAMETNDQMARNMGSDTINPIYASILRNRAIVAHDEGRMAEAYDWITRYAHLSNVISDSLHKSDAHYYVVRYQTKEQQLKIQEEESRSKVLAILAGAFALIMVVTTVASVIFRRQRQHIAKKNRVLVKMINDSQQLNVEDDSSEALPAEDNETGATQITAEDFAEIDNTIRSERLFSNANLQRQDICERFGISRVMLNNMLYMYRGNASLPKYINSIRMEEAVKLLRNHPDMSITTIAESVGFSPANFRKHFTRNFGMTPIEYRQNL